MAGAVTVKVDPKGRLTIPRRLREGPGIEPGDAFLGEGDEERKILRFPKAENPFDVLAEHAPREHRAGRSRSLHEVAADLGIALDDA
jgi:AbrB family looped-hinge helix DNA binding protein